MGFILRMMRETCFVVDVKKKGEIGKLERSGSMAEVVSKAFALIVATIQQTSIIVKAGRLSKQVFCLDLRIGAATRLVMEKSIGVILVSPEV